MRRFFMLAVLLFVSVPFGISVTGCHTKVTVVYCNGGDSGPIVGQITAIRLEPALTGLSLNQGQIGQTPSPSATDCKGNGVGITDFAYSSSNPALLDIVPTTGRLCAGTWNRNTGPVADYTYCTPNGNSGLVYVRAGLGATSNPLPVFVHPAITSIVLGPPSTNCATDPATNCSPAALLAASSSATLPSCTINSATGCCTTPAPTSVPSYNYACVSQGNTSQLAARAFASSGANISCQVGHLGFTGQTANIFTVDQNGVATAQQPGATLVSANAGSTSSSAGYFSTCPPASIVLTAPGTGSADPTNVTINQNTPQVLAVSVKDINGVILTGLTLTYNSTSPTTLPGSGTLTPTLPGVADITAVCMPPSCNPAPINEIGVNGNGKPLTSNPVNVTTPGTVNTVLFIASTQSQYIQQVDFTQNAAAANPVRLPFVPNSMVTNTDRTSIYMGTATELMIYNPISNAINREDPSVSGNVLSVSPDNATLVISDPVRQIIYLYNTNTSASAGGIFSTFGGVATAAQWSPDSQTVYISTKTNQLLVYSSNSGWTSTTLPTTAQSVAVTVPSVGAYLSGATTTGVSYCSSTTLGPGTPPSATNQFYPIADLSAAMTDQITSTNDGKHILGASITGPSLGPTLVDMRVTLPVPSTASPTPTYICPQQVTPGYFQSTFTTQPILGIAANSITGVTAATDTSVAYVTYTGTGGVLPAYVPSTTGVGTISNVTLLTNGAPAASSVVPVAGVFSTDNATFYTGTTGDNKIHIIVNKQDRGVISPNLPGIGGGTAVPNLLVQRPKTLI